MLSGQNTDLVTPTSATAPTSLGSIPTARPNRPGSLNIPFASNPQALLQLKSSSDFTGIPIQTPSTGTFNFDSLMDGGTGLTPVAGPLIPNSSTHNRNPLELTTPTSEPSKLVSL